MQPPPKSTKADQLCHVTVTSCNESRTTFKVHEGSEQACGSRTYHRRQKNHHYLPNPGNLLTASVGGKDPLNYG